MSDEDKDARCVGRDEMNLAEFPITLLTEAPAPAPRPERKGAMPPVVPMRRRAPYFRETPVVSGQQAPLVSIRSVPCFQVWLGVEYRVFRYGFTVFPGMVGGRTTVFPGMVYRVSRYGSKSQVARSLDLRLPYL